MVPWKEILWLFFYFAIFSPGFEGAFRKSIFHLAYTLFHGLACHSHYSCMLLVAFSLSFYLSLSPSLYHSLSLFLYHSKRRVDLQIFAPVKWHAEKREEGNMCVEEGLDTYEGKGSSFSILCIFVSLVGFLCKSN